MPKLVSVPDQARMYIMALLMTISATLFLMQTIGLITTARPRFPNQRSVRMTLVERWVGH